MCDLSLKGFKPFILMFFLQANHKKQFCVFHFIQTISSYARNLKEHNRKTYDLGVFLNIYYAEKIVFLLIFKKI